MEGKNTGLDTRLAYFFWFFISFFDAWWCYLMKTNLYSPLKYPILQIYRPVAYVLFQIWMCGINAHVLFLNARVIRGIQLLNVLKDIFLVDYMYASTYYFHIICPLIASFLSGLFVHWRFLVLHISYLYKSFCVLHTCIIQLCSS